MTGFQKGHKVFKKKKRAGHFAAAHKHSKGNSIVVEHKCNQCVQTFDNQNLLKAHKKRHRKSTQQTNEQIKQTMVSENSRRRNNTPQRKETNTKSQRKRRQDPKVRKEDYTRRKEKYKNNPNAHEKEKARQREKAHAYHLDNLRRTRYESTDIGLHDKLVHRAIEKYDPDLCPEYVPPDCKSTCLKAAKIVNPDDPNLNEVEGTDVWNTEYFEQWYQYCYDCDSETGKINKNKTLHSHNQNTMEHLYNLIRIDNEKMNNICMKTCCKCYERWFDTRSDPSIPQKQRYIKPLNEDRADEKFELSPEETRCRFGG